MTGFRPTVDSLVDRALPVAVYAALPTVGVISGPSYAPMIFGLAVVQCLFGLLVRRSFPTIDPGLAGVAASFAALCWASILWSIEPERSLAGAVQISAILTAALVFLALRPAPEPIFRALFGAGCIGALIVVADAALGYPLQSVVSHRSRIEAPTNYNRGLDHLAILVWPVLPWLAGRGRYGRAMLLATSVLIAEMIGASLAGRLACLTGALTFAAARGAPVTVAVGLPWVVGVFSASLPFAERLLTGSRIALARYIKPSGIHRLELWDFMSARVLERPILGWGILSASRVPVRTEELNSYVHVTTPGTYPHNQWLELWVETGACGVAIAIVFTLLVLRRIRSMPPSQRPYAYAAFAAAMTISCINFELTTDSWWAALAACGALFAMQNPMPENNPRDRFDPLPSTPRRAVKGS